MEDHYLLGLDLGSSSVKAAIVHANSGKNILSIHEPEHEMPIIAKSQSWAEQNPNHWWQHVCQAIQRVLSESQIEPSKIISVGISYQMHGLVLINSEGEVLRDSIIWCDSRAIDIGRTAFQDLSPNKCTSRLLNSPANFTASKLRWVKLNEPEIYNQTDKFMLPGDFIAYKLTNQINTTINGLSEGIFWDYKSKSIADWVLDYYGIETNMVPEIVDNFSVQGYVTTTAAQQTGLPQGIPLTYRAGDQPNNALALNIFNDGEIAATAGTSGVLYAVSNKSDTKAVNKINHFAHVNYTPENPSIGKLLCINSVGILYRWLKNFTNSESYSDMNEEASKVPVGSEELVILPFGNGAERIFDNMNVGAHFCGLNLNKHQKPHFYRAALEGIAFSFAYGMEILNNDNININVIRAGNDNLFRSKIFSETLATLIGYDIEIYNTTGAVGAARAAGISDNDFTKISTYQIKNDYVKTYSPLHDKATIVEAYNHWKKHLTNHIKNHE